MDKFTQIIKGLEIFRDYNPTSEIDCIDGKIWVGVWREKLSDRQLKQLEELGWKHDSRGDGFIFDKF